MLKYFLLSLYLGLIVSISQADAPQFGGGGSGSGDVTGVDEGTGIDITSSTGPIPVVTLDLTELDTVVWGSGTFTTMRFDAGASDPVLTASSGNLGLTTGTFSIGTAGVKFTDDGDGGITLTSLGDGSGAIEDIKFNLDDTSNAIVVNSSTGATTLQWLGAGSGTNFRLGSNGVQLSDDNDGALTMAGVGTGADENLIWNFDDTTDQVDVSTGTSVSNINFSMNLGLKTNDIGLIFGAGSNATITYDSNSTNDEWLHITFAESDGQSIPFVVISDASGADSTAFDNYTDPGIGFIADDGTTEYILMAQASSFKFFDNGGVTAFQIGSGSGTIFNPDGSASRDFTVTSDNDTKAIFVDSSTNSTGIFNNAPTMPLDVTGTIRTDSDIISSDTGDIGWSVVDQTDNQACTTGCTSGCVFGIANATGSVVTNIVSCADTTADLCVCAGAS